eukprot:TRINITY_DN12283_c0_g1_i1.p2 TRINITY_DN12283_c0_g1~~TRINITY_DN12283_c0_g1_i1.p2  ORF type:complete len:231 (+),score=38.50 TRINITY_DN12283_c0_g1_i1:299-991(+)
MAVATQRSETAVVVISESSSDSSDDSSSSTREVASLTASSQLTLEAALPQAALTHGIAAQPAGQEEAEEKPEPPTERNSEALEDEVAIKCPSGHVLSHGDAEGLGWACDACEQDIPESDVLWSCHKCEYDICGNCHRKELQKVWDAREARRAAKKAKEDARKLKELPRTYRASKVTRARHRRCVWEESRMSPEELLQLAEPMLLFYIFRAGDICYAVLRNRIHQPICSGA